MQLCRMQEKMRKNRSEMFQWNFSDEKSRKTEAIFTKKDLQFFSETFFSREFAERTRKTLFCRFCLMKIFSLTKQKT